MKSTVTIKIKKYFNKDFCRPFFDKLYSFYHTYLKIYLKYTLGNSLNFATIIPTAFIAIASNSPDPASSKLLSYSFDFILYTACIFIGIGLYMVIVTFFASKYKSLFSEDLERKDYIPSGMALLTIGVFSVWLNFVGLDAIFGSHSNNVTISHIVTMNSQNKRAQEISTKKTRKELETIRHQLLQMEIKSYEEFITRNNHNFYFSNDSITLLPNISEGHKQMDNLKK